MRRFARLRPFDVTTPEGRAAERQRRVLLGSLAATAAKLVSVITLFVTVPLTLGYLGLERYGMWATMTGVVAMLGFADFGIGNGVLNAVAAAHGRDNTAAIRRAVSSGFALLGGIALALGTVFACLYPLVDWAGLFNVSSPLARREAGPVFAAFFACFVLSIPGTVVLRVQTGLQASFVASLWLCAANLAAMAGLVLGIRAELSLPWLVIAFAGLPLLASLANTLVFFGWSRPDLAPRLTLARFSDSRVIAGAGGYFFTLQIVVAVGYLSDNLVIAHTLGPAAVAQYSVPDRLFSVISLVLATVTAQLWPAYGEALSRGDYRWVRTTLKRSLIGCALFSLAAGLLLMVFGRQIIALWVGSAIQPSFILLLGFAVWKSTEAIGGAASYFLNGAHLLRIQTIIQVPFAITSVAMKMLAARYIGLWAVVWTGAACFVVMVGVPYAFVIQRWLRRYKTVPKSITAG